MATTHPCPVVEARVKKRLPVRTGRRSPGAFGLVPGGVRAGPEAPHPRPGQSSAAGTITSPRAIRRAVRITPAERNSKASPSMR